MASEIRAPHGRGTKREAFNWSRSMRRLVVRLVVAIWVVAAVASCTKTKETLVITVGGLGLSQMHDLRTAITEQCPEAKVVSAGAWDAYKADIAKLATEKPRKLIVLIGHSFGCKAIDEAASELSKEHGKKVDLAVFIEPAWNDFTLSSAIRRCLWYRRANFDLVREAKIVGASSPRLIKGGHNDLPHSEELIGEVVAAIQRVQAEGASVEGRVVAKREEKPDGRSQKPVARSQEGERRSQKPVARSQEGEVVRTREPVRVVAPVAGGVEPPMGIW